MYTLDLIKNDVYMEYTHVSPQKPKYIPNTFKKVTFPLSKPALQGAGQVYRQQSTGWKAEKVRTHMCRRSSLISLL